MDRFEHSELAQDLFARVIDLEELFTHLQRTVQDLDEVVRQQHRRLDTLEQALTRLAGHLDGVIGVVQDNDAAVDERPPHY
ncbi:MAG: SlyX family protein [Pirellulales bacterium]|nr:SlyX family protein [Pirellulales bacterium]